MRIVNIGLCVFLLLVALVPLIDGPSLRDVLGIPVVLVLGIVCGIVFAAIAWVSADRDKNAREVGFGIGVFLITALMIVPLVRERVEKKVLPDPVPAPEIFDAAHLFADEVLETHPYRRANPKSDGGRAYAAAQSLLKKSYAVVDEVGKAGAAATRSYWDTVAAAQTREELLELKTAAIAFQDEAQECAEFFSKFKQTYTEELRRHGVSAELQAAELAEYEHHMRGYDRALVNLSNQFNLLADHLQSMIDVLIAEWGKWEFEPEYKVVVFKDPQALESYKAMVELLKDCLQKIKEGEDLKPIR